MKPINVLSLFDGMSCGQIALERAGVPVANYYAAEINKHAIKVSITNYPNTIHLGDVTKIDLSTLPKIDLLIGGSPCQSLSAFGDGTGLEGKSGLLFDLLRIKQAINPDYFLIENVRPRKTEWLCQMNDAIGCKGSLINSNLFVPQSRPRMYWTNIPYEYPMAKNTATLNSVLETISYPNKYYMSEAWHKWWDKNKEKQIKKCYSSLDIYQSICLTARMYGCWNGHFVEGEFGKIRRLTPVECERLQSVPDNYTSCVSDTERYKMLGNGWTVDVIAHIFSYLKQSNE